jgi:hypothetical protein
MTIFKWTLSLPAVTSFLFFAVMPAATLGSNLSSYREVQLGADLPAVAKQAGLACLTRNERQESAARGK